MGNRGKERQAQVLDILRLRPGPQSAYALLAELRKTDAKAAPPAIYRTLTALMEQGLVHRLESLNAFILCQCEAHQHASVLSICEDCGLVEENNAPEILAKLSSLLGKNGFVAQRHVIEVHGLCEHCGMEQAAQ